MRGGMGSRVARLEASGPQESGPSWAELLAQPVDPSEGPWVRPVRSGPLQRLWDALHEAPCGQGCDR